METKQGVGRCKQLAQWLKDKTISFSRIYTGLWDSNNSQVVQRVGHLKSQQILELLHGLYTSFDLVNFNMERGEFGIGAAFASDHLEGMQGKQSELRQELEKIGVSVT